MLLKSNFVGLACPEGQNVTNVVKSGTFGFRAFYIFRSSLLRSSVAIRWGGGAYELGGTPSSRCILDVVVADASEG